MTAEVPPRRTARYQLDSVGGLTPAQRKARTRDSMQAGAELTRTVAGRPRITVEHGV